MSNITNVNRTFIVAEGLIIPSEYSKIIFYRCKFDTKYYSNDLFSKYEIHFPNNLYTAVVNRKSEFLAGRYACKKALEKLKIKNNTVSIGKNRSPTWPIGIIGSITHTSTIAICAVSLDNGKNNIGIDHENIINKNIIKDINSTIITKKEHNYLLNLKVPYEIAFTITFSAKESLFKVLFKNVGKYFNFNASNIFNINIENNSFILNLENTLSSKFKKGTHFSGKYYLENNSITTVIVVK